MYQQMPYGAYQPAPYGIPGQPYYPMPGNIPGAMTRPPANLTPAKPGTTAAPVSQSSPAVTNPLITPKKSSAIRIKNPLTNEEVDLKALSGKKEGEKVTGIPAAPLSATGPIPVSKTPAVTMPSTPSSAVKITAPTPARSAALKIVDPHKKEVVDVSKVLQKEKPTEETPAVSAAAVEPVVLAPVEKPTIPKIEEVKAMEPVKHITSIETANLKSSELDDTLVSAGSNLSSPYMEHDSSVPSSVSDLEDGEIAEIERPVATILTSTSGITYPPFIEHVPDLSQTIKRYAVDFLRAFAALDLPKPAGLGSMEELRGDEKPARVSQDRRSFPSSGRSMQRSGSDYGGSRGSGDHRYSEPKGDRRSGSSRRSGGPSMARQGSGDGRHRSMNLPSRPGRSNMTPMHSEPQEVLVKSENAWTPISQDTKRKSEDETEVIGRKVKGLLNKLTIEKFTPISQEILNVGITTTEILTAVIDIIFEKALDEPNFGAMYALLCSFLSFELPNVQVWVADDAKTNAFRRGLLGKCQYEFFQNAKWSAEDGSSLKERQAKRKMLESLSAEEKLKIAEEDYERAKLKRRVLGNIRFIGELFIKNIISEKIMHSCVTQLLSNVSDPEEEDVESLCKLMATIGSKLDIEKAKAFMDSYFERIKELSTNKKLSSRIRFMLLDLIDLRRNGWKARVEVSGPKTIAEIHKEAERKAQEEAAEKLRMSRGGSRGGSARNSIASRGGQRDRGDRDHRSSTGSQDVREFRTSRDEQIGQMKRTSIPDSFGPGNRKSFQSSSGPGKQTTSGTLDITITRNSFDVFQEQEAKNGDSPLKSPKMSEITEETAPKLTKDQVKTKVDAMIAEWWSILDVRVSYRHLNSD